MQYQNTAAIPSFGQRQISFVVHSGANVSPVSVTTFFLLSQASLTLLDLGTDTVLCEGQTLTLDATTSSAVSYLWNNNPNTVSPVFTTTTNGSYTVSITNYCGTFSDAITATFTPLPMVNLGKDTIICDGETLILDATDALATSYNWQNGSTNPTFSVVQTGLYIAEASSNCGTVSDTIDVIVYVSNLNVNLGLDFILCPGDTQLLDVTTPYIDTYSWNTGSNTSMLNVTQGGVYTVQITDICNFTDSDTIDVTGFVSVISVNFGDDTTLCTGEELPLDVNQPTALSYVWQNGSTGGTFTVKNEGNYGVTITDYCGSISDSIYVQYLEIPQVEFSEDTSVCEGRIVFLNAFDANATDYLWQDGSTAAQFVVQQPGVYKVIISNACATAEDSIEVKYADNTIPLLLHPDVAICDGDVAWIGNDLQDESITYEWSTGQTVAVILVEDYGTYTVKLSNGCIERSKDIVVKPSENCCPVFLPDAFSPNGDTYNDTYKAFTSCTLTDFELVIFDRWGTVLFRTTDQDKAWDGTYNGKLLSTGVFIWKVRYNDGKFDHTESGNLTLIK
ncbi:MAG: T9SS type B sorting domain-containing protein [Saprospiraceae bacterium]|nr:T9SS type B sorting domain-containing protein [Saprospiraceae bacterium]